MTPHELVVRIKTMFSQEGASDLAKPIRDLDKAHESASKSARALKADADSAAAALQSEAANASLVDRTLSDLARRQPQTSAPRAATPAADSYLRSLGLNPDRVNKEAETFQQNALAKAAAERADAEQRAAEVQRLANETRQDYLSKVAAAARGEAEESSRISPELEKATRAALAMDHAVEGGVGGLRGLEHAAFQLGGTFGALAMKASLIGGSFVAGWRLGGIIRETLIDPISEAIGHLEQAKVSVSNLGLEFGKLNAEKLDGYIADINGIVKGTESIIANLAQAHAAERELQGSKDEARNATTTATFDPGDPRAEKERALATRDDKVRSAAQDRVNAYQAIGATKESVASADIDLAGIQTAKDEARKRYEKAMKDRDTYQSSGADPVAAAYKVLQAKRGEYNQATRALHDVGGDDAGLHLKAVLAKTAMETAEAEHAKAAQKYGDSGDLERDTQLVRGVRIAQTNLDAAEKKLAEAKIAHAAVVDAAASAEAEQRRKIEIATNKITAAEAEGKTAVEAAQKKIEEQSPQQMTESRSTVHAALMAQLKKGTNSEEDATQRQGRDMINAAETDIVSGGDFKQIGAKLQDQLKSSGVKMTGTSESFWESLRKMHDVAVDQGTATEDPNDRNNPATIHKALMAFVPKGKTDEGDQTSSEARDAITNAETAIQKGGDRDQIYQALIAKLKTITDHLNGRESDFRALVASVEAIRLDVGNIQTRETTAAGFTTP